MARIISKTTFWVLCAAFLTTACSPPSTHARQAGEEPNFDNVAENAKFIELVEVWRNKVQAMNSATIRFHNADSSLASKHRTEFQQAETEGRTAFDAAYRQACLLLARAPEQNSQAGQFAMMGTFYRFARNWYEQTGETAEMLLNTVPDNRGLPEITGVSLFSTNQYELARPFLERAVEMGLMDGSHRGMLQQIDSLSKVWKREAELRAEESERDDLPRISIKTTKGEFVVELFEDQAPNTVANFIALAEQGAYRGVPFYQVLDGEVALAGDTRLGPMSTPFFIQDEGTTEDRRHAFRGSLCMAKVPNQNSDQQRTFSDSASSHFFIPFRPMPVETNEHVSFGRIIEGIENFSLLRRIDTSKKEEEGAPKTSPDLILSMDVIRKRDHDYTPERIPNPLVDSASSKAGSAPPASDPND